jgi:carbon-monoxide dehydrogenase medium subunit
MVQEYLRPRSIEEAISFYKRFGEKARYIAGGTDLMLKIMDRQLNPAYLISLKCIPGLDQIEYESGELRIGALTTHRKLELSPVIQKYFPVLRDAVENIGSVQVRNVATIGGNIVNAAPSADGATPLIVLMAKVRMIGVKGSRTIDLEDFFVGPGQTLLEHGEILYEFIIPKLQPRTAAAYWKHTRRAAMELPILSVAVSISLAEDMQTCVEARIGLGVMAPTPVRAKNAEKLLKGKKLDEQVLKYAGKAAAEESRPRDTARGEAWYRREVVEVLIPRVVNICVKRVNM